MLVKELKHQCKTNSITALTLNLILPMILQSSAWKIQLDFYCQGGLPTFQNEICIYLLVRVHNCSLSQEKNSCFSLIIPILPVCLFILSISTGRGHAYLISCSDVCLTLNRSGPLLGVGVSGSQHTARW